MTAAVFTAGVFYSSGFLTAAFFLTASMTLHSFMEIFSNGKTMRPVEDSDDRAVYNHLKNKWIEPRRWVLCSSRRDLILTLMFSAPLLFSGIRFYPVIAVTAWGVLYFFALDRVLAKMEGYDRFSEYFQYLVGLGPEVGSSN